MTPHPINTLLSPLVFLFGSKKTGKIVFEDLSKHSVFFRTEVKPKYKHHTPPSPVPAIQAHMTSPSVPLSSGVSLGGGEVKLKNL